MNPSERRSRAPEVAARLARQARLTVSVVFPQVVLTEAAARLARRARALWGRIPAGRLEVGLLWAGGLALGGFAVWAALGLPPAGALLAWGGAALLGLAFVARAEPLLWDPDAPPAPAPPVPVSDELLDDPGPIGAPVRTPPVAPLLDLVPLPGGAFRMGSPPATEEALAAYAREYVAAFGGEVDQRKDDWRRWQAREQPAHPVRVSSFLIARTPVTRAQWRAVRGESPKEWSASGDDGALPATHIDWPQSLAFCNALSEREGLTPCYHQDDQGEWHWNRGADGYRLPTEAEWEYACRAGTRTRWFWGEDPAAAERHAWYSGNAGGSLQPVGTKAANPWGLHDLAGLVYEWCWDRHGAYPPETDPPPVDPVGPGEGGSRVVRGGSFFFPPGFLRSAGRVVVRPDFRNGSLGLRCIRSRARQP